jgi:uncharacterized protein DUF1559
MINLCRHRAPGRTWLILAGLAAAVAWAAVNLGAGAQDEPAKKLTPELAWVPPDAALVVQLRPAELWNSATGKSLHKRLGKDLDRAAEGLEKSLGVHPREIEQVTIVFRSFSGVFGGGGAAAKAEAEGNDAKPPPVEKPALKEKKPAPPPDEESENVKEKEAVGQQPGQHETDQPDSGLLIVTVTTPATLKQLREVTAQHGVEHKHKGKAFYDVLGNNAVYFANDRTFILGSIPAVKAGLERTAAKGGEALPLSLRTALGKHHLVVGMQLSQQQGPREVAELLKMHEPGIERTLKPLMAASTAVLWADAGKESRAEVELHFPDEASARRGLSAALDGLALFRILVLGSVIAEEDRRADDADDPGVETARLFGARFLEEIELLLGSAKGEQQGKVVRLSAHADTDLDALDAKVVALVKARLGDEAVRLGRYRSKSASNLKQIGIALHNVQDSYKYLPPTAILDKQTGKPLLSWRVAILPYIEDQNLYLQFKLDEPWDSAHNKKLLERMPSIYAPVGVKTKEPHQTFYRGFVTAPGAQFQTAWQTNPNQGSPFGAWGARMPNSFPDGTANTIWVVEAGEAVPWTKPDELVYDEKKPLPQLGGLFQGSFNALLVDASVIFVRRPFDERTLRDMITANDGNVVDLDRLTKGRK